MSFARLRIRFDVRFCCDYGDPENLARGKSLCGGQTVMMLTFDER